MDVKNTVGGEVKIAIKEENACFTVQQKVA
jgi:hypothetical protein